jgi:ankyrin repeat domain-containing protein 50
MLDPLTAATGVAGLLSLTIQVSQVLYEQVQTLKNAPSNAQELLDELQSLRQVLTSLEAFLSEQGGKGRVFKETSVLINAIKGCNTKITALKLKFENLIKKQGFARMIERGKWYYEHDEHQEIIAALHRYLGIFQISLSLGGM